MIKDLTVKVASGVIPLQVESRSGRLLKEFQKTYPFRIYSLTNIEGYYVEADDTYSLSVVSQDTDLFAGGAMKKLCYSVIYYRNGEDFSFFATDDLEEGFVSFVRWLRNIKQIELRDIKTMLQETEEFVKAVEAGEGE